MLNDVKKVMIAELDDKINESRNQESAIREKIYDLYSEIVEKVENQLSDLNRRYKVCERELKRQYNLLEKIFYHKDYREHKAKLNEYKILPQKIAKVESEIEIAKMQFADKVSEQQLKEQIEAINKEVVELHGLSDKIRFSETLAELNMLPNEAMDMLEQNGIQPVLDESDRKIFERPRNYQSKSDLIAVHKTRFMPSDSKLKTRAEANVMYNEKVMIDDNEYQFSYPQRRNTLHVTVNCEVGGHDGGNWDDCRYTVLQPFDAIPSEKIAGAEPSDTFTRGGIDLTNDAWILCPVNEVEKVKQQNSNVHVLGYKGENSNDLASPFLSQLGYRAESNNAWGWSDDKSQNQFNDIMRKENIHLVKHCDSTDVEDETLRIAVDRAISLYKMLREQKLVQSSADYDRIQSQVKVVDDITRIGLGTVCLSTNVMEKSNIDGVAIVANGKAKQYFVQEMQKAGFPVSTEDCQKLMQENASYNTVKQILVNSILRTRQVEVEREM